MDIYLYIMCFLGGAGRGLKPTGETYETIMKYMKRVRVTQSVHGHLCFMWIT